MNNAGDMNSSNIEILAYEPTPLGFLCLRRRALLSDPGTVVTEITLNHEFLMSSANTISERQLARSALDLNMKADLKVLVGGLGLGYTAREVLTSKRVGSVEVVELLPEVIAWLNRGLFPLAEELKGDARLSVSAGDIFDRLSKPPDREFDLILIDVDHAPDENLDHSNSAFYTEAGLWSAKAHLAPHGVLAVWSYAENASFAVALQAVFKTVSVQPVSFENKLMDQTITDWLFFARE
jgi:spermidine synthase